MKFIVNTDGGARGNPGPAGIGFVISDGTRVVKQGSAYIGTATNNVAEYEALIRALTELKKVIPKEKRADAHIEIRMDSELAVKQLSGTYQIKDKPLQLQFMKIWNMRVAEFSHITFVHIPREENSAADALVNKAIDNTSGVLL